LKTVVQFRAVVTVWYIQRVDSDMSSMLRTCPSYTAACPSTHIC